MIFQPHAAGTRGRRGYSALSRRDAKLWTLTQFRPLFDQWNLGPFRRTLFRQQTFFFLFGIVKVGFAGVPLCLTTVARNCGILICKWIFLFRVRNCAACDDWFLEPNRFADHELLRNLLIGDGFGDNDLAKNRPVPHFFWEMSAEKHICSKTGLRLLPSLCFRANLSVSSSLAPL